MKKLYFIFLALSFFCCSTNDDNSSTDSDPIITTDDDIIVDESELYFPPINGSTWLTETPENLNWNTAQIENLYAFLEENNSRALMVLKDGKIVLEQYWGNDFLGQDFNASSLWYWASAGKTMTAFLTGIAQNQNFLNIEDPTSNYLGEGWTSTTADQEIEITIKHQLTMTTGLDYNVENLNCLDPECLHYKSAVGTEWFYYNAPYSLLHKVIESAAATNYNDFTNTYLKSATGITGSWVAADEFSNTIEEDEGNIYFSNTRSAARFGLLLLNEGIWDETSFIEESYFEEMVNSSQTLNPAYGYLTWLNGKSSIIYPTSNLSFNFELSASAPNDMYTAIGKNGQFIQVVPSENLVVVRFGDAPNDEQIFVPTTFNDKMWDYLNLIIP